MGVIPVITQVVAFLLAGYFIGRSESRSFQKNLFLTAGLAFGFSLAVIIWTRTWGWTGIRFVLINVSQLTIFGAIGVGVGYLKVKRENVREEMEQ